MRPTARHWSRMTSTSLDRVELVQYGRDVNGAREILHRRLEQAAKSVFDVDKTSGILCCMAPSSSISASVQPGLRRLNALFCRCTSKLPYTRKQMTRRSTSGRANNPGGGNSAQGADVQGGRRSEVKTEHCVGGVAGVTAVGRCREGAGFEAAGGGWDERERESSGGGLGWSPWELRAAGKMQSHYNSPV